MASAQRLRLLVVDDEPEMRAAIARAVQGHRLPLPELGVCLEFAVEGAGSGETALEAVAEDPPPDLLMLDHKLPGISGLEVLRRLAERPASAAPLTIVITAYASLQMAVEATKQGAFDLLAKPFTPAELKATLAKAARHLVLQREAGRLAREQRAVRFHFLRTLAHELKAPLAAIHSYLALLRDGALAGEPELTGQAVARCLARVEGMRKLIGDLLDLTLLESGEKRRDPRPLDLAACIRPAADGFRALADERRIAIAVEAPETLICLADPGELEMIFNNLISNAIKYNRDGGRITLRLLEESAAVRLEVTDTGIGLGEADRGRLFREFSRIRNRDTEQILGSGLGLSIVQRVAALHGGTVGVSSRPGVGSTFWVRLPRGGADG